MLSQGGITAYTSDGPKLFEQDLRFPEGVVEDPPRFARLVAALATRAAHRRPGINIPDGPVLTRGTMARVFCALIGTT